MEVNRRDIDKDLYAESKWLSRFVRFKTVTVGKVQGSNFETIDKIKPDFF